MPKPSVIREDRGDLSVLSIDGARRARPVQELNQRHGDYLRALARKLCRAHLDPDDLVQDVFEKTLRSPVPDGANERAWLTRVMQNLFIDRLRRRDARREDPMVEVAMPAADERPWWEALDASDIRAAAARLPEEQRVTFEMFAFDGKSYDEIAAELGIAKATVGTRILRARQRLRELITREHHDG